MNIIDEIKNMRYNRTAILAAAAAALVFFLMLVVTPLNNRARSIDSKIDKARGDLKEIAQLVDEYIKLSSGMPGKISSKKTAGSLSGEVDKLVRKLGIEKKIKRMTPKLDSAKKKQIELGLTVTELPLAVFIDLLENLYESPAAINIRRARIKPGFKNRDNLEVELTLVPAFL